MPEGGTAAEKQALRYGRSRREEIKNQEEKKCEGEI